VLQVRAASACCKHEKAPIGFLPVGAFLLADLTKSAPKTASIEKNRLYQKGKRGSTGVQPAPAGDATRRNLCFRVSERRSFVMGSRARHGTPRRCRVAGRLKAKAEGESRGRRRSFEAAGWRRQAGDGRLASALLDLHIGDTHHAHARPNTTTPHKRKTLAPPETLAGGRKDERP
jgi:hypothetical protein